MKKYFFISMAVLALLFTACKKDDDSSGDDASSNNNNNNDDTEQVQTLPVPVKIIDNSQNPFQVISFGQALWHQTTKNSNDAKSTSTTTIEYDGRVVLSKTTDNGSEVTVRTYYYNNAEKGLLDSIVITKNQQFEGVAKYTISNDKIQAMKMYDSGRNLVEEDTFTYNGDKVSQFTTTLQTAYGPLNMTNVITYTGDDMTGFTVTGDFAGYPLDGNYSFDYDDKNYTELNVVTLEYPFVFEHNMLSLSSNITVAGQTYSTQNDYSYTYNTDDYPIESNYTLTNANGTTSGTASYEYENK